MMESISTIRTFDWIDVLAMECGTPNFQTGITSGAGSMTWKYRENADPPFWFGGIDNAPFSCRVRLSANKPVNRPSFVALRSGCSRNGA
jgi:hypothetical protein